jgi:hypothetical protein
LRCRAFRFCSQACSIKHSELHAETCKADPAVEEFISVNRAFLMNFGFWVQDSVLKAPVMLRLLMGSDGIKVDIEPPHTDDYKLRLSQFPMRQKGYSYSVAVVIVAGNNEAYVEFDMVLPPKSLGGVCRKAIIECRKHSIDQMCGFLVGTHRTSVCGAVR